MTYFPLSSFSFPLDPILVVTYSLVFISHTTAGHKSLVKMT